MLQRTALRFHSLMHKKRLAVGHRQRDHMQPVVLGVCGGSGSGKTTFCEQFQDFLGYDRVLHLKQDDYYKDLSHLSQAQRDAVNFDHPDSVEFSLLALHLDFLSSGRDIAMPQYDFATHCRTLNQVIASPRPIILVEGILLFADSDISSRLNHKVFIDASDEVRFSRRLQRDLEYRGRTQESITDQYNKTVRPMYQQFVEPFKKTADKTVSGEEPFGPSIVELCGLLMGFGMEQEF